MPLTDNEVFDVYGLIVGMTVAEGKNAMHRSMGLVVSDRPANDWRMEWINLPSVKKAHAIYTKISRQRAAPRRKRK